MFENFVAIECGSCFYRFGMSQKQYDVRKTDHKTWWCPACGCQRHFTGMSAEEKLRQENARLLQRMAQKDDEIKYQREKREENYRSKVALRGVITRTKKRISGGACPCCNRTFQNLARHMTTKHKDYVKEKVA